VNKTAASAFCFKLIHVQTASSQLRENKQILNSWFNKLA